MATLQSPFRPRSHSPSLTDAPPSGQEAASETWLSSSLIIDELPPELTKSSPWNEVSGRRDHDSTNKSHPSVAKSPTPKSKRRNGNHESLAETPSKVPPASFHSMPSSPGSPEPPNHQQSRQPESYDCGSWRIVHDDEGINYFDISTPQTQADVERQLQSYVPSYTSACNDEFHPSKRRRISSRSPSPEPLSYFDPSDIIPQQAANTKAPSPPRDPFAPVLTKEQNELVELIVSGKNVHYTGSAGCGKSTVLKEAVRRLQAQGLNVQIVAPTGCASLQVNGKTTWSFMGWTPDLLKRPLKDLIKNSWKKRTKDRLRKVDVLIIDEISMVENHFFERMDRCMRHVRELKEDPTTWAPFGGCQIIVTGDFCQLSPVKPFSHCIECGSEMEEEYEEFDCPRNHGPWPEPEKWVFFSDAWKNCNFTHFALHRVHRQSDPEFLSILQKLRVGKKLTQDERLLLMDHPCDIDNATHLYPHVEKVKMVNGMKFLALPTPKLVYKCLDSFMRNYDHLGHDKYKERLYDGTMKCLEHHKFDPIIELKKDMLVVLQVNLDLDNGLCNGSQGVICGFEEHNLNKLPQAARRIRKYNDYHDPPGIHGDDALFREQQIRLFALMQKEKPGWPIVQFHNGQKRTIYPYCVTDAVCIEPDTPMCLTARTQIPLTAGWALTIHRCQGMTLDKVIVDLSKAFDKAQVYVALSRAKGLSGLKIEGDSEGLRAGEGGNPEVQSFLREHNLLPQE